MILVCWLTVFLVLPNLQPQGVAGLGQGVAGHDQGVTGHGQGVTGPEATGPPLNCGAFSTNKVVDLTRMSLHDQKKMLNRFVACIGANSCFLDIDGLYFIHSNFYTWNLGKCTGLMCATSLGFNDLARTLIHYDANINVRNEIGSTSLMHAALTGNNNMIGILLGLGAHVNGVIIHDATPLHAAAAAGHVNTVRLLLENGADFTYRSSSSGYTALNWASQGGHTDVVALLQSWGR